MIRLLVKLVVAALLANAIYRVGSEYLTNIRFRDAVRDAAMFKARTDDELRQRILQLAAEYDVPLTDEDFAVSRENRNVSIDGGYEKPIEVLPRYQYPWHFSLSMEVIADAAVVPAPVPR